jgi:glycine dehydrogenase
MGPIGVAASTWLLSCPVTGENPGGEQAIHAVSAAPWGSASILPISYAYIAMMGGDGLNPCYGNSHFECQLHQGPAGRHYPVLYVGSNGRCAHEMIVDCRSFKGPAWRWKTLPND